MSADQDSRWQNGYFQSGKAFADFWEEFVAAGRRDILFIVGHGFDPRMCACTKSILKSGGAGKRDALVVEFNDGSSSPFNDYRSRSEANRIAFEKLFSRLGTTESVPTPVLSGKSEKVVARTIVREISSPERFSPYTDVVVDISALPRGIYLPLLSALMELFDETSGCHKGINFHVVVSHCPDLDRRIKDAGAKEDARLLPGFAEAIFDTEANAEQPSIWIPLLGHAQASQLKSVRSLVNPDEICPLLPSPARNPREADDLVSEYRELLFDDFLVERQNVLLASESDPFEVCRQITRSVLQYRRALGPLGGCKVVLSAHSSKLASLGAAMAAHELWRCQGDGDSVTVGMAHVEVQGYYIEKAEGVRGEPESELVSVWIAGECYE